MTQPDHATASTTAAAAGPSTDRGSDDGGTIDDFGAQWLRYRDNEGYYASVELLRDVCGPLLDPQEINGARVLEIGSGTGRIVDMLVEAGAEHVVAVEPSAACDVLRENVRRHGDRVSVIQATGDAIPDTESALDLIVSIGVLHHIPDPDPVVRRAYELLPEGGRFLFWVYGKEGNRLYLALAQPLRAITTRLPDAMLGALSHLLNLFLTPYIWACRFLPLPLAGYLRRVLGRFGWRHRSLVIFDQLNPGHARYYLGEEAEELMRRGGFENVVRHHRHSYSWTVLGTKPLSQ